MLGFDFWAVAEASAVLFGLFGLILVFLLIVFVPLFIPLLRSSFSYVFF